MMNIRQIQGLAVVAVLLLPFIAAAQSVQADLRRTLKLKQSLSLEELTDEYMAIKVGGESQMGGTMPFMFMGMMMEGDGGAEQMEKIRYFDARWTKGDVVMIGGTRYLATYRTDTIEVIMAVSGEFSREKGLALHLELVNLDNIKTISPLADLTPAIYSEIFGDVFVSPSEPSGGATAQTRALSNIKQLSIGMLMYGADYDDLTPYAQSTKTVEYVISPYIRNYEVFKTLNPDRSRFLFNMAIAGVNMTDIPSPAETVMFFESRAWPDGRRVVSFCDGHAKIVTEEEWQEHKLTLKLEIKKSAKPLPAGYGITIDMNGRRIPPPG